MESTVRGSGCRKPKRWLGESLLSLIRGEERRADSGVISEILSNGRRKTSYRTKRGELILDKEKKVCELYNLEKDSKESNNVAEENPDIVKDIPSLPPSAFSALKIKKQISKESKIYRGAEERRRIEENIKRLKARGKI